MAARVQNEAAGLRDISPVHVAQVFGMRRSGNHAIINWLMRNAPDAATGGLFYNNCRPGTDPTRSFAALDVYGADFSLIPARKIPLDRRRPMAGAQPLLLVSYEDVMPRPADKPLKAGKGLARVDSTIVIYRSFLNWAASLLAKIQKNPGYGPVERMRIMFRAMQTYRQGLERLAEPQVTGICYDSWAASAETRAALLDRLGLPCRDNGLGEVQRFGGGSSFSSTAKPEALETLSRADQMAQDPEFQVMLWSVAHDAAYVEALIPHFPQDAERLARLAETASTRITLPPVEPQP